MWAKTTVLAGLLVLFTLAGCLVTPVNRGEGAVVVPFLPPVVVFDEEPYYFHEGFQYHYLNGSWYYAHARNGPWTVLPRDHYPREIRFKNTDRERDRR